MTAIALRVENLGKQTCIGGKQERYQTLRDAISDCSQTLRISPAAIRPAKGVRD